MTAIIKLVDDVFANPDIIRELVLSGEFEDVTNPEDGVVYPAISRHLDTLVLDSFHAEIERAVGFGIKPFATFSRAMHRGMVAPNKIHSDRIMARYAAHVYLSTKWPDGSGTSFWEHRVFGPVHDDRVVPESIDSNEISDWQRLYLAPAAYNRMLIHHGDRWHLAEPVMGWGDRPDNARLVITCFFDRDR